MDPICHRREGDLPWEWLVGWIPLVPKTLQSLETVISASHRELQCHLHNSDIESRTMMLCHDCGDLDDSDNCVIDPDWCLTIKLHDFFLFKLAYPSCICLFCVYFYSCNDRLYWMAWAVKGAGEDTPLLDRSWVVFGRFQR